MSQAPDRIGELISSLKQQRDELSVRMHLAGMELKDEWDRLDEKLSAMSSKYDHVRDAVADTADDVWESLKQLGGELTSGFNRIAHGLSDKDD